MKTDKEEYVTYETTIIKRNMNNKPKDIIVNINDDMKYL